MDFFLLEVDNTNVAERQSSDLNLEVESLIEDSNLSHLVPK
jgi:hypothetical protein